MRRRVLVAMMLMMSGSLVASTQPFNGFALYEAKDMEKQAADGLYADVERASVSLVQGIGASKPTSIAISFDGSRLENFPIVKEMTVGCAQKVYVAKKVVGSTDSDVYLWHRVILKETQPGKCQAGVPGTAKRTVEIETQKGNHLNGSMELKGSATSTDVNTTID